MKDLRPIRPLAATSMRGVVAASAPSSRPEFLWVDPQTLLVEEVYQRRLGENGIRLIRRIVAGWDWARFKPPIVSAGGDGSLYVIDGQHTAIAAATHGGIGKIPVMCVNADALVQRAAAFIGHNRDRLAVTPMQMHHSLLAAGDEVAAAMATACGKAGAEIVRYQPATWEIGQTVAVAAIREIVTKKGSAGGARVLKCFVDAERAPVVSVELKAAASILFAREPRVEATELARVIRMFPREEWERRAHRRREHLGRSSMMLWQAIEILWREELDRRAKVAA